MKKILLVINPVSGKLKAKAELFDVIHTMTAHAVIPTVMMTRRRGEAKDIAASCARSGKFDAIFCCGGDGTLNEVITGVVSSGASLPVGYIPAGSTNDFAAALGLPLGLPEAAASACRALNAGQSTLLDVGRFGSARHFTYVASFGAFAASSYSAPQSMKNVLGHFAYLLQGAKDFFAIKPIHVRCTTKDGRCFEDDYIFGGVTNTTSVGGIVKLDSTLVDMSDGEFEVVLVKTPKSAGELNTIVTACLTSNLKCDMIEFFKAREVKFELPQNIAWTLDGEEAHAVNPLITNLHKAAELLK
jgi:YegS/Rv2252/BmrU family lipid kinase